MAAERNLKEERRAGRGVEGEGRVEELRKARGTS